MEETQDFIEPVTIQPKIVFGLNTNVIGNIHFNNKQEVIYPIEGVLAFHDYASNRQKFLRLPEHTNPKIIAISPNRKLLAIVDKICIEHKVLNSISVYDLATYKKRKTVSSNDIKNLEITVISFTADSKAIAVLSKPPEERLFLFLFDKMNTVMQGHIGGNNPRAIAEYIACNPNDFGMIAVAGKNIFKFMTRAERGFSSSSGSFKCDGIHITSLIWISSTTIVAGTNTANLLFIENGELKAKFNAFNSEIIDLAADLERDEGIEQNSSDTDLPKDSSENKIVVCMTSFNRGFVYVIFNAVYVFEKESKLRFERRTILRLLPNESLMKYMYQIMNVAVNVTQDTIIVTAKHAQIYVSALFSRESLKTKILDFEPLGQILHTDEIVGLSVCSWKSIIMTASKDKTIRIWNYETEKLELIKRYEVDVTVVELHPLGILAAIGFSGQLKLIKIYYDDLDVVKTFNFPHCNTVKFSTQGHFLATAYENLIAISTVFSFETLKTLVGHFADVLSISWSRNDKFLASGGVDGAIYLWDVDSGTRIQEFVNKGVQYPAVAIIQDNITVYALTSLSTFREITNTEIVREIEPELSHPSLLSMALSRSEQILFVSSDKGHIFSIQLPFMESGGGRITNYRYFNNAVTDMKITYDDTLLITASKAGTLGIWVIKNIDGKIAPMDRNLLKSEEILIPRKILVEKNKIIGDLELRMKEQVDEYKHEIIENEIKANKNINKIRRDFQEALSEQQRKFEGMLREKSQELMAKQSEIDELKKLHEQDHRDWEEKFSERVLSEYEKYTVLQNNYEMKCAEYEEKLQKSNEVLRETIASLEKDLKRDVQEKEKVISKLQEEKEDRKIEFIEYCRQVEEDNERFIVNLQKQHEFQLKEEKDAVKKWRGEAKVLSKKFKSSSEINEKLSKELEESKEQHLRYQKEIEMHLETIDSLNKEILNKKLIISSKEKEIEELQSRNFELQISIDRQNSKIHELQNERIQPLEEKLKEERHHLAEIECNLEKLESKNKTLEHLLNDSKGKYIGYKNDAMLTKQRKWKLERYIADICDDIHVLAKNIHRPNLLKNGIRKMYEKYCKDESKNKNRKAIECEFIRQHRYLEMMIMKMRENSKKKSTDYVIEKLIQEKIALVEELNIMRRQLKDRENSKN